MSGDTLCYATMAYCLIIVMVFTYLFRAARVAELPAFKELSRLYKETDDILERIFLIGRVAGTIWLKRAAITSALAIVLASFSFLAAMCGPLAGLLRFLAQLGEQLVLR